MVLNLTLLFSLLILASHFCTKATDGFSILAISGQRGTEQIVLEPSQEAQEALSQPYTYLASGSQCFVFTSRDGRYVVKFFKQRLYNPSLLVKLTPLPRYRQKQIEKRQDKWARDFASYKLAFEELKEESALLYIHLHPTAIFKNSLTITDRLHIAHRIDLNTTDFILQRRAESSYDHIRRLMREGQKEQVEEAIQSMKKLITSRCQKGFRDRDPDIRTNCGFVGNQAVKLDVGRLEKTPLFQDPEAVEVEVERIMAPFYQT